MLKKIMFCFFAISVFFCKASYSEVMDLEQCIKKGIENNPSIRAAKMMVNASKSGIKAARADFLPSLNASGSFKTLSNISSSGQSDTDYLDQGATNYYISMSQILYSGSGIYNSWQKAKLEKEMYEAEKELKTIEIVYQIHKMFFELMKSNEESLIWKQQIESLEANVSLAQAYYEKKFITLPELLDAKVELENAVLQKSVSDNNVKRKRAELLSLMGLDINLEIEFEKSADCKISYPDAEFEKLWEMAQNTRPDIKSLKKQIEITNKNVSIQKGRYLPSVKFNAGYYDTDKDYKEKGTSKDIFGRVTEYDRDQRNRYWSAEILVQMSLFDGGRAWYNKNRYLDEAKKIESILENTENKIKTGINKALFSIKDAKYRIEVSKKAVKSAKEFAEMEKSRFDSGLCPLADLLEAEEKYARAKSNFTTAKIDLQLAYSELKFMVGNL
jgi:outer membrane protein TolC